MLLLPPLMLLPLPLPLPLPLLLLPLLLAAGCWLLAAGCWLLVPVLVISLLYLNRNAILSENKTIKTF